MATSASDKHAQVRQQDAPEQQGARNGATIRRCSHRTSPHAQRARGGEGWGGREGRLLQLESHLWLPVRRERCAFREVSRKLPEIRTSPVVKCVVGLINAEIPSLSVALNSHLFEDSSLYLSTDRHSVSIFTFFHGPKDGSRFPRAHKETRSDQ
eukprot:scaffold20851_cov21-Tisochrysis_lutea.AAC.1